MKRKMKKKKKRNLCESKLLNIKKEPKKLNAFEMHVNRRKFDVLGMKLKSEKGLPGISRSRALKKRKATILQEYKLKDKKNTFLDRRIGEKNSAMTTEDKIMARFTAERMKFHSKKSIFNLDDSEELTHKGESLMEIEKYDDPKSDDEFDGEMDDGKLNAEFVGEGHFGGGIFKKADGESKSRKDLIEQLIAESKKRKAEKQKLREETFDLTQKLDSEWKELQPLISCSKNTETNNDIKKDKKTASYDILSKQLKFEARGKPMDRLKSEEEIAKEERKKLEELEQERLKRMIGENNKVELKHRSADDLDDGFLLEPSTNFILNYNKKGLPIYSQDDADDNGVIENANEKSSVPQKSKQLFHKNEKSNEDNEENEEEENNLGDDDDDDDDDVADDADDDNNDDNDNDNDDNEDEDEEDEGKINKENDVQNEENQNKKDVTVNKTDQEMNDAQYSSDEESVDLSDLKESDESEMDMPTTSKLKESKKILDIAEKNTNSSQVCNIDVEMIGKLSQKIDEEKTELPFTFEVPNDYETFEKLINTNCSTKALIIERMIKCNHPSLKNTNREKLDTLFTFLLQHLEDSTSVTTAEVDCFKILDSISPFLYDLTQWNPESCSLAMITVLQEKYENFLKNKTIYPGLDTLIFLKLIGLLFSTSDYRHKVVTPALIFMQHILSACKIVCSTDVSTGLFISSLILEYCLFSKRFVPELFAFIKGILRLCHSKDHNVLIILPFRSQNMDKFNLIISDKSRSYSVEKMTIKDLITNDDSDEFKIKAISLCLQILSELCDIFNDKPAAILLFEPFIPLLGGDSFHSCLKTNVESVLEKILAIKNQTIPRLVLERKRPKPLKLYEPKIEEIYTLKKRRPMGKAKEEKAKLQHKYKKELKGALREIRRDSSFLTKLKLKEIRKSDIEREHKVREILGSVAQQTGEVKKLKKKK